MGLDVYVGPLSRYYGGAWETIVQQSGRESGLNVEVVRSTASQPGFFSRLFGAFKSPAHPRDPVADVKDWMASLARYSSDGQPFTWDDSPDREYFTDKPAWDCYGALLLWAVYDEARTPTRPATAEGWEDDDRYNAALENPACRYHHLVGNTQLWLPRDFDPPFAAPTLSDEEIIIGSNVRLLSELDEINNRTWRATADDLEKWRRSGADYGGPLETSAKFGFAVFHDLARKSVEHRLPMKLDY